MPLCLGHWLPMQTPGKTVVLGTTGMFAVELRTSSGEELNLGNSKVFLFQFQLLAITNPSSIGLWSFRWIQRQMEGRRIATLVKWLLWRQLSTTSVFGIVMPPFSPCWGLWQKWSIRTTFPLKCLDYRRCWRDLQRSRSNWWRGVFCGKMPKG